MKSLVLFFCLAALAMPSSALPSVAQLEAFRNTLRQAMRDSPVVCRIIELNSKRLLAEPQGAKALAERQQAFEQRIGVVDPAAVAKVGQEIRDTPKVPGFLARAEYPGMLPRPELLADTRMDVMKTAWAHLIEDKVVMVDPALDRSAKVANSAKK